MPLNNITVVIVILVIALVTIAIYDRLNVSYPEPYNLKPILLILHKNILVRAVVILSPILPNL